MEFARIQVLSRIKLRKNELLIKDIGNSLFPKLKFPFRERRFLRSASQ